MSGVASVDRALSVLTAFKRGDKALSLAELTRRTGLVKTTVLRLAISLEQCGLLKRLDDGRYRLDAEVLRLAAIYQDQIDLEALIFPVLKHLVDMTEETASFYIRRGEQRMCLFRVDSPHRLRLHIRPGDLLPMDESAIAQVLRSFDNSAARRGGCPSGSDLYSRQARSAYSRSCHTDFLARFETRGRLGHFRAGHSLHGGTSEFHFSNDVSARRRANQRSWRRPAAPPAFQFCPGYRLTALARSDETRIADVEHGGRRAATVRS